VRTAPGGQEAGDGWRKRPRLSGIPDQTRQHSGVRFALSWIVELSPAILDELLAREREALARERQALAREREALAREREAREEAEAANRLKDEFLATLSHELRTPLNAIMGWTSLLRQHTLDDRGREHAFEVIERNARNQQQLIDDLLEVSQIIRGQLHLDVQRVNLVDAVRAAVASVAPAAQSKRQSLEVDVPREHIPVSGDRGRLQQILWNLLSNAVKYTPRGGAVWIDIAESPHDVVVSVRDTGAGIPPEVLPHIFERFRQGASGTTREHGGLGLGLAIVRHLIEAHGGTVQARSDGDGRGSTFTITLPRLPG
jgi:signal transduction histidine kinase